MTRKPEAAVDPLFIERWSPRAFESTPVAPEALASIFEAARWAPSCFNEQPWLFLYATTPAERARFAALLVEKNRAWAADAPVIAFALARKAFARNDKPNRHAMFDTGAAWMSLTMQARLLGLYTHAMAGIDVDGIRRELGVPDDYEVICGIVIGHRADPATLEPERRAAEQPNGRKPLAEVAIEGGFPGSARK
ncbi:MAG: nitroreductase family protein [bacterium]